MKIGQSKIQRVISLFIIGTILIADSGFISASQAQTYPAYAKQGAYALYDVVGGSVAFFDGVQGNISYTVTNVFSNSSMIVKLDVNITQGSEIPATSNTYNYTDNILNPRVFPAVPVANLSSHSILFQNVSCSYVTSQQITVNNMVFQTVEYQGTENQTTITYWFDTATGLAIEEASSSGAEISIASTNIATPIKVVDPLSASLPIIIIFMIIFAATGLGYFEINRYYARRARKDFKKKLKKERRKEKESQEKEISKPQ